MSTAASVSRLAQYRPFEHDGLSARAALTDLVVAAAMEADGTVTSLRECQDHCQTLWGLEVELYELRPIFEELVTADRLIRSNGTYVATETLRLEVETRTEESAKVEERALEDWLVTLRLLNARLSDEDLGLLRSDLDAWLEQLIRRHGVEAALLLYPEAPRAQGLIQRVEGEGFNFLPRREARLEEVREQGLTLFVRQPTEAQRTFLASLLNTAYFMTILTLDPTAAHLVQELTAGQRVYLDTNFIYRVLNLQSPRQHLSAKRLLELTQQLGYQTAVTPWTVYELKESLERAKAFLMSRPIPPAELAELAANATTDENFVTAYWRRLKEHPISPKDFVEFYEQIEDHLAEHEIDIADEGCIAIDRQEEAINEQLAVIERVLGSAYRHDAVKLHDVKHRLLVERLRGDANRRFSTAGFWFLTCDSLLPRYDHAAQEARRRLSFCVSSSAWTQVMRSFTPRTEDFDQTLTDLLASPYIRYRGRISYQTVEQVVGRVAMYEGRTPELAAKVMLDTALLRKVAGEPDEETRHQLIHDAIVRRAEEVEQQLQETRGREQTEREARRLAEEQATGAVQRLADAEQRAAEHERAAVSERQLRIEAERKAERETEALRGVAEQERQQTSLEIDELKKTVDDHEAALKQMRGREDNRRLWVKRGLSLLIGAVGALASAVPIALGWVSDPWPLAIDIGLGLAAISLAACLVIDVRRVWIAIVGFGVVLGILAGLHELFS